MGFKGEIFHLPNAINIDDYPILNSSVNRTVIYFGRLSKEKGIYTLLRALNGLPVDCKIYGDGPEKENLEKALQKDKIKNITLCGYIPQKQLQEEIKKAMFVILPSEWYENNPLAVIESFALGKTVIGSRIGGIPELIRDHETGLTFEPGNAAELRKNVLYLLDNSEKILSLGKNARSLIEREYTQEKQYQDLMNIYQRALEKNE
jgi:glycosyltransferase involved in cell wall biosynthesis